MMQYPFTICKSTFHNRVHTHRRCIRAPAAGAEREAAHSRELRHSSPPAPRCPVRRARPLTLVSVYHIGEAFLCNQLFCFVIDEMLTLTFCSQSQLSRRSIVQSRINTR